MAPGLYRRITSFNREIGLFSPDVDPESGWTDLMEIQLWGKAARRQRLEAEGRLGPRVLERLNEGAWTRQTLRLI